MHGFFIHNERPGSKDQLREAIESNPESVLLEFEDGTGATKVSEVAPGYYSFAGPDPIKARGFYGMLKVKGGANGYQRKYKVE